MAGAAFPEASGRGKRKAVDAVINVVPFIDLLSCCLAFLLLTAAWTQIARLKVEEAGPSAGPSSTVPPLQLVLSITAKGYRLSLSGNAIDIGRKGDDYDVAALGDRLKEIKDRNPEQRTISVAPEDGVPFDDLVHAIDTCMKVGLDSVSVEGAS